MPTEKQAIKEALLSLDTKNDKLWTDDGSPLVSEVQRAVNDKTVTRAQINDALPGFTRVPAGDETGGIVDETGGISADEVDKADDGFDVRAEPEVNGPGQPMSEDEVRAVLTRRVSDAQTALADARRGVSDAQQHMFNMEKRLTRAMTDHQRRFPPVTAAANIKEHLARQTELRYLAAGIDPSSARAQIDVSMERHNRRGWTRPVRHSVA